MRNVMSLPGVKIYSLNRTITFRIANVLKRKIMVNNRLYVVDTDIPISLLMSMIICWVMMQPGFWTLLVKSSPEDAKQIESCWNIFLRQIKMKLHLKVAIFSVKKVTLRLNTLIRNVKVRSLHFNYT